MKLPILTFLYCGEFVQNLNAVTSFSTWSPFETPTLVFEFFSKGGNVDWWTTLVTIWFRIICWCRFLMVHFGRRADQQFNLLRCCIVTSHYNDAFYFFSLSTSSDNLTKKIMNLLIVKQFLKMRGVFALFESAWFLPLTKQAVTILFSRSDDPLALVFFSKIIALLHNMQLF